MTLQAVVDAYKAHLGLPRVRVAVRHADLPGHGSPAAVRPAIERSLSHG